jgi:hypothetical protein
VPFVGQQQVHFLTNFLPQYVMANRWGLGDTAVTENWPPAVALHAASITREQRGKSWSLTALQQ